MPPHPIPFEEANVNYGLQGCGDLPALVQVQEIPGVGAAIPTVTSCWILSTREIEEIQKTGCVWVRIVGSRPQPMNVAAFKSEVI